MQPLLLLKQTLEATYDPGSLKLDGPNVLFTSASQLLSHGSSDGSFSVMLATEGEERVRLVFRTSAEAGFDVVQTEYGDPAFVVRHDMSAADLSTVLEKQLRQLTHKGFGRPGDELRVQRDRCFLTVRLGRAGSQEFRGSFAILYPFVLEQQIRNVVHVPGYRGNPLRTYPGTPIGPEFPGTFQNYLASVIHDWQEKKDARFAQLAGALESLGLTWKVHVSRVDDTQLGIEVGRLPHSKRGGAYDLVSIADVGFGVSQVLPVVVALLAAEKGQLVFIEQPEIHMHPKAQRQLAHLLADAATRGARVVVETHSSLLLLGVQALVAKGELPPDMVKLHWFKRDPASGETQISSADLDNAGAFGDWPEDFGTVSLEAQGEYLDAAERKLAEASQ